jgi:D-tyrosyl-tRNA(Tyr) deacylase
MRAVVQRVNFAFVQVENQKVAEIGKGLLVFVGVGVQDDLEDIAWLKDKILSLRIFNDADGKMNLSIDQVHGEILVVSQFTLLGDCRKGRRPSYSNAALPEQAKKLYEIFVEKLRESGIPVKSGIFQAYMKVVLENDGPVTLLLDSKKSF